ncbi:MAG: type II toxin-antitoxin system PemK/MazF family toxin [Patescibacteria group bacterium]
MKPGDIWVVHIPELGTHEQSGVRPAIVVATVAKTIVTIIPCTGNKAALRFPFTLPVVPTEKNGLTSTSIALIFHIRAIDTSLLKNKIGELNRKDFALIKKEARRLIG